MADTPETSEGPKIPKYVKQVPWYQKERQKDDDDYLSHHQKDAGGPVDFSEAQAGRGFKDYSDVSEHYDSKRDRWEGYEAGEYEAAVEEWEKRAGKRARKAANSAAEKDSQPDYGVEMIELGLLERDMRARVRQDAEEKTVRDRNDVPDYIKKIGDTTGAAQTADEFVRSSSTKDGLISSFDQTRAFTWEKDREFQLHRDQQLLQLLLLALTRDGTSGPVGSQANLSISMEASPTAAALQARKDAEAKKLASRLERQKMLAKYGVPSTPADNGVMSGADPGESPPSSIARSSEYQLPRSSHLAVWGSFYSRGSWGYACCRSLDPGSECTRKE